MLSKLMKHEFRATGRILLPVYLLLLLTSGLCCLFLHLSERYDTMAINIFQHLTLTAFIITAVGAAVLTAVLMVYRFYKNLMTDEGYLMFTLPASTGQIIWSKLIVALVWSAVTLAAECLAVLIATAGQVNWRSILPEIPRIIKELQLTVPEIAGYTAEGLLLVTLAVISSFLMFYAAIALGHSFANHKILLSVVFYIAFTFGLQMISSFGLLFGAVNLIPDSLFENSDNLWLSFQIIAWTAIAWSALISAGFYILTHFMLKRRLNLQ